MRKSVDISEIADRVEKEAQKEHRSIAAMARLLILEALNCRKIKEAEKCKNQD